VCGVVVRDALLVVTKEVVTEGLGMDCGGLW